MSILNDVPDVIKDSKGNQYSKKNRLEFDSCEKYVKYLNNKEKLEVPLLSTKTTLLKKPIVVTLSIFGKGFKAENKKLKISLSANTPSEAMKKFMEEIEDNIEKYYDEIDIIIDKNIKERHKKAWLKLAEM
ncbi:MAG: hypothetical protein K8T10_04080 [Candidatus Eremiobacteraeota bacterium]|nr:hypothetical protein [Candidatus Eremiobacteraeota bacterium]